MGGKNMKKIFLVISIISVLFLAGCNKNIVENENNQVQEEQSNNQNTDININKNDNEEFLETTYSGEGNIIFENETLLLVGTKPTADAWYEYSEDEIFNMSMNDSGKLVLKYSWYENDVHYYINNNIFSLLIIKNFENGTSCDIYNIDMINQKEITDKELIQLVNLDYSKCIEKVKEITLKEICSKEEYERVKLLPGDETVYTDVVPMLASEIVDAYEKELNKDSSEDTEFYLNENGDLCFDKVYIDNRPAIAEGEYMYNLTKDEEINKFNVGY